MIYVAPGAQKTDGYQANRNLTLSPKARADSIPGLEILADDVRCTHGATAGQIPDEYVFYLMARGISFDKMPAGELIYLNLPLHPGSKLDKARAMIHTIRGVGYVLRPD